MSILLNVHATLISFQGKGILLTGESGSGKSDLALRLIMEQNAKLVADDRVILEKHNDKLIGYAPLNLANKLEVRGLGIVEFKAKKKEQISLCVNLCKNRADVERLPQPDFIDFLGISVAKIELYPFDCSTIYKIILKTCGKIC